MADFGRFRSVSAGFVEKMYRLLTPADERTRGGHKKSFKHIRANTTLGQNSFLYKTIPDWNHLPPAAIESRSIAAFKSQLSD